VLGEFIVSTNRVILRIERGMADLRREMKDFKDETKADRKEMNRRWGDLANRMGTIVEDIVVPNIPGIARNYFGIQELDYFAIRVKKRNTKDRSMRREFDVIASSEEIFIVNETKPRATVVYANEFVEVLPEIPDYFPESKGKRIIPIYSSLHIPDDVVAYLTKRGIYAMGMKNETMDLLNFEEMKPNGF
jgi:hypothetical protein